MKWEYLAISGLDPAGTDPEGLGGSADGDAFLTKRLTEIGDEGWELVSMIDQGLKLLFIFKRPLG
jgi:hypothetical protein